MGCADDEALYRKLHIDARRIVEPIWRRPPDRPPEADMWGIVYRSVSYGSGAYLEPDVLPLAGADSVAQIHAHRWPSCDEFDYAAVTQAVEAGRRFSADPRRLLRAVSACTAIFAACKRRWRTWPFGRRSPTPFSGHIFDFYYEHHRRIFEAGGRRIDLTYVAEDLGSQTGPLMSLAMYRRFLLPNQIKMAELARSLRRPRDVSYRRGRADVLARLDRSRRH